MSQYLALGTVAALNCGQSLDYVNIKGTSTGINLGYKMPLSQTVYLKPSIGYYKYSFSNILRENTTFGTSNSRNINFISPLLIPFFSDKYYYNCLAINIGLEKLFTLRNDFYSNVGFQLNNYLTFSQNYHLTSNPEGSQNFKKNKKEYFGSSGLFNVNILKKVKDVSFGPSLMFPLFDFWKTDETFQEETNSQTRNKLFKGICIGISVNYSLNKKQSK